MLSGLNIPNKKPGEPLLDWVPYLVLSPIQMNFEARILVKELPDVELTVHYSCWSQMDAGPQRPEVSSINVHPIRRRPAGFQPRCTCAGLRSVVP